MQGNGRGGYMPPTGQGLPLGGAGGMGRIFPQPLPPQGPQEPLAEAQTAAEARQPKMTAQRLKKANDLLRRYKAGKAAQDQRVVENERWYRQRHWELMEGNGGDESVRYKTKTAWLFNALNILHSDAMEAFPRLNVLPREQEDEEEAQRLSSILPVVMAQNGFKEVYDLNAWRKGRSGTAVYGIFWDPDKLNGLGDIAIRDVDVLNLFWEPGRDDLQKSANVFHVEMIEKEALRERYPDLDRKALSGDGFKPREYDTSDHDAEKDRSAVIDWYYKVFDGKRTVLHYCKYVGTSVIYASEDDWNAADGQEPPAVRGWYDHGQYPFVIDAFYPVEGTCAGFGLIDVNKQTQMDIDLMQSAIVTNTSMRAYPRYFRRNDGGINDEDLMDWTKPLIGYDGNNIAADLQPVEVPVLPGVCVTVLNNTIEALKQTSGSTDFATGRSSGGVTAYSAIAALIETAGKNSKDFSRGSYGACKRIGLQVIELIRQWYNYDRQFRIVGEAGRMRFVDYNNQQLQKRALGMQMNGEEMYRLPLFDLDVTAERETTYTRLAQNELAKELMGMGVFNPQMADQSLMMLDMMDFDGKDTLVSKLQEMSTLTQQLQYYQQIALALAQRYDPGAAEQIAQAIMQQAPGSAPVPAAGGGESGMDRIEQDPISGVKTREHANGPKARGLVQESTRPT